MRWRESAIAVVVMVAASPAMAQDRKAAEIFEAVTQCRADRSHDERLSTVIGLGWRNETPSLGGRSMGDILGAWQLRKRRDSALISSSTSPAGENCQFDFDVSDGDVDLAVTALLDNAFDTHGTTSSGTLEWVTDVGTYSLIRRADDQLTLLWLVSEEMESQQ